MKLLLDINVLLDVLLDREPWSNAAARLLSAIETGRANGYVAAHTLPTIYYVLAQARDRQTASTAVAGLLEIVDIVPAERADLRRALSLPMPDFEDAVQAAASIRIEAAYLVTRNERDFRRAPIRVADPAAVLALI